VPNIQALPRGITPLSVVLLIIVALIVIGGAYFVCSNERDMNTVVVSNASETELLQTYTHNRGFSIKYPNDWTVLTSTVGLDIVAFAPNGKEYLVEGSAAYPIYIVVHDQSVAAHTQNIEDDRMSREMLGDNTFVRFGPKGTVRSTSYLIDLPRGSLSINDNVREIAAASGLTVTQEERMRTVFERMVASLLIIQ
jgi:hypothetical protein